ncbi:VENN motif pre-toxin domain-containing protein, partial [Stenoxybacter acetivorans]|uniref:VENN motif pre-toxin domain-containing protein n=1 Tax=Stenoxybacter acetivorans TaxID=422441 RepID=UPI0005614F8C
DTEHANSVLAPIFNLQKVQDNMALAQVVSEIVSTIATTAANVQKEESWQQRDEALKALEDTLTPEQWEEYRGKTKNGYKPEYLQQQLGNSHPLWQNYAQADQLYQKTEQQYGIGSPYQRAAQALAALAGGIAGGNLSQAATGAAMPYAANQIGQYFNGQEPTAANEAARILAHAALGAAAAYLSGGADAAVSGAAGAASGEVMAKIVHETLFGGKPNQDLTETEKDQIRDIANLAAGLVGGVTGGGVGAVTGAVAGDNAVVNNYLSQAQQDQRDKEIAACQNLYCRVEVRAKWTAIDIKQDSSFAAGVIAGVPIELYDTAKGIISIATSPIETYEALKALFSSDDVLSKISNEVKQSYIDRINHMEMEFEKAGSSGSFNAGVEGGKLITDIVGLIAGGAGTVKSGATLTEKIVAKVTGKSGSVGKGKTGTIFDSIKETQPVYPGSVIPKSFEMTLPNGQKVWVHENATEHIVEYAASKAVTHTPEAVRLASQVELKSFQSAVNTATKNKIPYNERITVDGWQLEFKPPRSSDELPTIIHARYVGAH